MTKNSKVKPKKGKKERLTADDKQFVSSYMLHRNISRAYREIHPGCEYSTARSEGSRLFNTKKIQNEVNRRIKEITDRYKMNLDDVVNELTVIARSNMRDFVQPNSESGINLDFSELSYEQAAAIQEVKIDEYMDCVGHDDDGKPEFRPVKSIKFKLYDKRAALIDLGKHLGGFKTGVEHSGAIDGIEKTVIILPSNDREFKSDSESN